MISKYGFAIAALLSFGQTAFADTGPPASYVDALYVSSRADDAGDADGFAAAARFGFGPGWFLQAGAGYAESDVVDGFKSESKNASLGLGFHLLLGADTDVDLAVNAEYVEVELDGQGQGFKDGDTGYSVRAGLRTMLLDELEGGVDVTYVDVFGGNDASLGVFGVYYFLPMLGVQVRYGVSEDVSVLGVGLRWYLK